MGDKVSLATSSNSCRLTFNFTEGLEVGVQMKRGIALEEKDKDCMIQVANSQFHNEAWTRC